ncbi:hypothetical protein CCACVL1_02598 [Corchorus capsularis]|uniref:FACT complex subunit n=1 Tax=Corchorus capsularis TaxID=210143 RepID=A0A1R3K7L6_COCAP|nr:hypothetical protein CCACVL1_02598 [Corchorus capsularis]
MGLKAASNKQELHYSSGKTKTYDTGRVIICALGVRYKGKRIGAAYRDVVSTARNDIHGLVPYLTKSAGIGIGLELSEMELNITSNNVRVVEPGMVFKVSIGFHNLPSYTTNLKDKKIFSLDI